MARLLAIEPCTVKLRNSVLGCLRAVDEAILLPQAHQSIDSNEFKNVVFRINGTEGGLDSAIFNCDWFSGLSAIRIRSKDERVIEAILENPESRKFILNKLSKEIISEIYDPDIEVGPPLDCDDLDRDVEGSTWKQGFDSTNSFVGIFSAENPHPPENGNVGMTRVHKEYFLVCRAGGGTSASTFHSRVLGAVSSGLSLDQMFLTDTIDGPGPVALRRVATAGTRNRARLLYQAGELIGLKDLPAVGDQAGRNLFRGAVSDIDVTTNVILKLDERSKWQYSASCVEGSTSKGLASLSNSADGLVLFLTENNDMKLTLKNETWGCLPYTTEKILNARDRATEIVNACKLNKSHPDADWLHKRFTWKNRVFSPKQPNVEPFALLGSYKSESFTQTFARELGLADLKSVRLRPELVCMAGVEGGKLRAIVRALGDNN